MCTVQVSPEGEGKDCISYDNDQAMRVVSHTKEVAQGWGLQPFGAHFSACV